MNIQDIGGKAANLEALRSIVRVKPFVTIPVTEVNEILKTGTISSAVLDSLVGLPCDRRYAVRSSAVGEDSNDYSWAGQFKTTLNVVWDNICSEVVTCAQSLNSDAIRSYAENNGIQAGGLAIIVQEMVDAECAGVLFTKNPVGSAGEIVIEAIEGNAERLVSGLTEPARYYLQQDGTVTREEAPNDFSLTRPQLQELFAHATTIRGHFGSEQDIEWAFDRDGTLYINQSRPITGLEDVFDNAAMAAGNVLIHLSREKDRLVELGCGLSPDVLSNQNIAEILTPHPTQMAHGLFCHLFAHGDGAIKLGRNTMGYEIAGELDAGFQTLVAGKPMMSVIHDAFTYRIQGIPLEDYCVMVNEYLARIRSDESLANYPEICLYDQDPSLERLVELFGEDKGRTYRTCYENFFKKIRLEESCAARECLETFVPKWNELIDMLQPPTTLSLAEAVARYEEMCWHLRIWACTMFVRVNRLCFFAVARVRNALVTTLGEERGAEYLNTVLAVTTQESPNYRFSASLARARNGLAPIEETIQEFGHLGEHELEISTPRYSEQVHVLETLASKATSPEQAMIENGHKARVAMSELSVAFQHHWPDLQRDIDVARTYSFLREVVKFNFLKGYGILRRLSLSIEQSLGWRADLIFHLDPTEVFRLVDDHAKLHDKALLAAQEWSTNRSIDVPSVVFADKLGSIGRATVTEGSSLRGIGVTNHVFEGECVVLTSLLDSDALTLLKPGSVLVTVTTDPAWAPVIAALGRNGAVVTEIGGLMAHTATCVREQHIAAVLNVAGATKTLKTGMRVRVDGPAGMVTIL